MKQLNILIASMVLTTTGMLPAVALADMDDLDVTMEVLDDIADIDGQVLVMRGPDGGEESDEMESDEDEVREDDASETDERESEEEVRDEMNEALVREDGFEDDDDFRNEEDGDHTEDESDFDDGEEIDEDEFDEIIEDEEMDEMHEEESDEVEDDEEV